MTEPRIRPEDMICQICLQPWSNCSCLNLMYDQTVAREKQQSYAQWESGKPYDFEHILRFDWKRLLRSIRNSFLIIACIVAGWYYILWPMIKEIL